MSLINNMLKDLETRRQGEAGGLSQATSKKPEPPVQVKVQKASDKPAPSESKPFQQPDNNVLSGLQAPVLQQKKKIPKKAYLILLILPGIYLVRSMYAHWSRVPHSYYAKRHIAAVSVQKPKNVPNKMVVKKVAAATIDGLSFEKDKLSGHLLIKLSQAVHYSVKHGKNHQLLTITLLGARATEGLQDMKPNSWFQDFSIKQLKEDTKIGITMQKGVELQKLDLIKDSQTQLNLTLYRKLSNRAMEKSAVPLGPKERADLNYNQALQDLESHKTYLAIKKLRHAIRLVPGHAAARKTLAALLFQQKRVLAAKSEAQQGLKYAADDIYLIKILAQCYAVMGKQRAAISLLLRHTPQIQTEPDYYALLASLYQRTKKFAQAAKLYGQLVRAKPGVGLWWLGLGMSLESLGEKNAALQAYNDALKYSATLSPGVHAYIEEKVVNMHKI